MLSTTCNSFLEFSCIQFQGDLPVASNLLMQLLWNKDKNSPNHTPDIHSYCVTGHPAFVQPNLNMCICGLMTKKGSSHVAPCSWADATKRAWICDKWKMLRLLRFSVWSICWYVDDKSRLVILSTILHGFPCNTSTAILAVASCGRMSHCDTTHQSTLVLEYAKMLSHCFPA